MTIQRRIPRRLPALAAALVVGVIWASPAAGAPRVVLGEEFTQTS